MDIKSKKWTRSILAKTIAFIMVVILFTACVYSAGYLFYRGVNPEVLLVSEYKDSNKFENEVYNSLNYLHNTLESNNINRNISEGAEYYVTDGQNIFKSSEMITPELIKNNKEAYFEYVDGIFTKSDEVNQNIRYYIDGDKGYNIYLTFSKVFLEEEQRNWEAARDFLIPIARNIALALGVILGLVIYLLVVTGKIEEDDEIHANFVDKIYTEILILGYIAIMGILVAIFSEIGFYTSFREWKEGTTLLSVEVISIVMLSVIAGLATIATGIFLLSLARRLKTRMIFKGSLVYIFLDRIVGFGRSFFDGSRFERFPLTKILHQRQVTFIAGSFGLVALTFLLLALGAIPLMIFPPIAEIILIYWYFKYNKETFKRSNKGFDESIEEQMKAERLKVNLVTNVSHDLKTPLTSIISYLDLLSKEELSEVSRDYVNILIMKSERLKNIVADLFDLAKSTSGEINLEFESLDLKKLLEQTLADMDDNIIESKLQVKATLPEEAIIINSDGKKLYRVVQNLIDNALKYSLAGTRIFIDLIKEENKAILLIKNTASYEMNFSTEEILQRFYRGEEARSGEGSGLGLSIAESFTNVSGGNFDIEVDGDQFKVTLTFRIEK